MTAPAMRQNLSDKALTSGEKAIVEEHDDSELGCLRLMGLLVHCVECIAMDNLKDVADLSQIA